MSAQTTVKRWKIVSHTGNEEYVDAESFEVTKDGVHFITRNNNVAFYPLGVFFSVRLVTDPIPDVE